MPVLGNKSKANLKGVHPDLVRVIEQAIVNTPIDFTVFSGVRTQAEQKRLYSLGRTVVNPDGKSAKKPLGNIVTNANGVTNKSNHQVKQDGYGHAVDLYAYYDGKIQFNDSKSLKKIADHVLCEAGKLGVAMEWGGNWKFVDAPHFQLKK